MARSKIVIQIPTMSEGNYISFETDLNGTTKTYTINWVGDNADLDLLDPDSSPINTLLSPFDILAQIYKPYTVPNYDAVEYAKSIDNLDFLNNFSISRIGDTVTIQSRVDNLTFQNEESNNPGVVMTITNQNNTIALFEITDVAISAGTNPCDEVTITVTTTELADNITSPFLQSGNTNNPFSFQYLRGQKLIVAVGSTALGQIDFTKIQTPQKLSPLDVNVDVVSNNLGKSATINYNSFSLFALPLELTYSIDGTNFSSNNVFENLADGDYTAYVKDEYGCVVQKDFTFVDTSVKTPYNYISKTNSLRFAERVEWDNISIYKNDENTLSDETLDKISESEIQRFQTSDRITTQLRSNFDTIKAFVVEGGNETPLIVWKPREYLGIKDYRDCVIYKSDNGKTGVYFTTGDKYNYDSGLKTGEYELNGSLPVWYRVGSFVNLEGVGIVEIKSVFFDEDKSVEVAEVDYNYTGNPTLSKVKSIYDLRNFNLHEFTVDFASYENKCLRVKIVAEDAELDSVTWISEKIHVRKTYEECLEIRYHNSRNDDIFYETGIKNLLRLPFEKMSDSPISESEIHKGDDEVSLVSAEYYEGDLIEFLPLTKELSKKLELALKHTFLTINGVNYRTAENPEKNQLDDSNLYVVKAQVIKAGNSYSTNSIIQVEDNLSIDVPEIISTGNDEFIVS